MVFSFVIQGIQVSIQYQLPVICMQFEVYNNQTYLVGELFGN